MYTITTRLFLRKYFGQQYYFLVSQVKGYCETHFHFFLIILSNNLLSTLQLTTLTTFFFYDFDVKSNLFILILHGIKLAWIRRNFLHRKTYSE